MKPTLLLLLIALTVLSTASAQAATSKRDVVRKAWPEKQAHKPPTGLTPRSLRRPTPLSGSCSAVSAAQTSGITAESLLTRWALSATNSLASSSRSVAPALVRFYAGFLNWFAEFSRHVGRKFFRPQRTSEGLYSSLGKRGLAQGG